MKTNKLSKISLIFLLSSSQFINAQDQQKGLPSQGTNFCGTSEAMQNYYKANPNAKEEQAAREAFTAEFVKKLC